MPEFILTMDDMKVIYKAGIERGIEESSAYEWGGPVSGNKYDELVDAIHGLINKKKSIDDEDYVDYSTIKKWVD